MSTVNLAEIVAHYTRNGAECLRSKRFWSRFLSKYIPPDMALAYEAGGLISLTGRHGPSLGDHICLALAKRLGAPALSADRSWTIVAGPAKVAIEIIR